MPEKEDQSGIGASFFRKEAYRKNRSEILGAVKLAQPLSATFVAIFGIFVIACIIGIATCFEVTKKSKVRGVTSPLQGTLTISALSSGIIGKSNFSEGDVVKEGDILFEISTARRNSSGELGGLVAAQLRNKKNALEAEKSSRTSLSQEKLKVAEKRLRNLDKEEENLDYEIALAAKRQGFAERSVGDYQKLISSGYVSAAQLQEKSENLVEVQSRSASLQRTKIELDTSRIALKAEILMTERGLKTELAQIDRELATLAQEEAENDARHSVYITAPQDGIITTITYQSGQAIASGQVIATLIPHDERKNSEQKGMEVLLYAQSRAAGFVQRGQMVHLRFDAFPYQKFGLQKGVVTDVSATPFAPTDLPANIASTVLSNSQQSIPGFNANESLYRIRVSLHRQNISLYGDKRSISAGMTVEADIVQSRRMVWEWIAEPLLAMSAR